MDTKKALRASIGREWYDVLLVREVFDRRGRRVLGLTNFGYPAIRIATHTPAGSPRAQASMQETLWHEVTHAILFEMGRNALNADEEFVREFGKLLSRAMTSLENGRGA